MLTMKFGGTSVGDIQRLQEVASIVHSYLPQHPVVVASAMAGVTNTLLETANLAVHRETERVKKNIEVLKEKHLNVANTLLKHAGRHKELIHRHAQLIDELSNLYRGVGLLKELSVRSLDAIASFGEIMSCLQLAAVLCDHDVAAEFVDARTLIRTDGHFGEATVDFSVTNENVRKTILPMVEKNIVPVVTGFIGNTEDGLTTTLGRSGSDFTGSIIGAAIDSSEIWIWTDVDGVMTADPRHVKGATVLPQISYREAAEMSYFGAKVIHPKTMMPAIEKDIAIRIKNTFNPTHPGTLICPYDRLRRASREERDIDRQPQPRFDRRKRDGGSAGNFCQNFFRACAGSGKRDDDLASVVRTQRLFCRSPERLREGGKGTAE